MRSDTDNVRRFDRLLLVRRILAWLAGAIFVYAGIVKLTDPLPFATDISNYQLIPRPLSVGLAFYLPWLELLCGLALISHRFFAGALVITMALMLAFIGASIAAKARGIDVACGCFGNASSGFSFTWHLALDLAILAVLAGLWSARTVSSATNHSLWKHPLST